MKRKRSSLAEWIYEESVISTEGLVCPYCGHLEAKESDPSIFYEDAEDEHTCPVCSKEYEITQIIEVSWETRPKAKYYDASVKLKTSNDQLIAEVERQKRIVEKQARTIGYHQRLWVLMDKAMTGEVTEEELMVEIETVKKQIRKEEE